MPVYSIAPTNKAPYYSSYRDAVHGALAQEECMDTISNNLANVNTPGFKADRLVFNDAMTQQLSTSHSQGSLQVTDNPFNLAITGPGFFKVQTPAGVRLTRNGSFTMDADGNLVTSQGYKVLSSSGSPVALNPDGPAPHISASGTVQQGTEEVGDVGIFVVDDPKNLAKDGANLFTAADNKQLDQIVTKATDSGVRQGALEASNVIVVKEMVEMINSFRAFESYQKAIRAMNEIDLKAASQLGSLA